MSTTDVVRPPARLVLQGSASVPADVEVVYQPRATRLTRAILSLGICWVLMPLVFFIPPHVPWVFAAFAAGIVFFVRSLRGEYHVASFEGACPRCGRGLEIKAGSRIRGRHVLDCYGCHRQPELVLEEPRD